MSGTNPTCTTEAPLRLTGARRWLSSWLPSVRIGVDPLAGHVVEGRYAPVSIANWKLTPFVRNWVLEHRKPQPLTFADDQRLTVVIPYRDREAHLAQCMPTLRATLDQQVKSYRILIVEQLQTGLFNRARLINTGIHFAKDWSDYYCLHDVDAVPVVANYKCPSQPLRLVTKLLTEDGESSRPDHYFSGAISVRKEQVFAANGFSNDYWGWGKEDDDFFFRLLLADCLCFYDREGVFHDLPNPKHQQVRSTKLKKPKHLLDNRRRRSGLLRGQLSQHDDGLGNLRYEVVDCVDNGVFTKVSVRW
jgi:hypothetical protein